MPGYTGTYKIVRRNTDMPDVVVGPRDLIVTESGGLVILNADGSKTLFADGEWVGAHPI